MRAEYQPCQVPKFTPNAISASKSPCCVTRRDAEETEEVLPGPGVPSSSQTFGAPHGLQPCMAGWGWGQTWGSEDRPVGWRSTATAAVPSPPSAAWCWHRGEDLSCAAIPPCHIPSVHHSSSKQPDTNHQLLHPSDRGELAFKLRCFGEVNHCSAGAAEHPR